MNKKQFDQFSSHFSETRKKHNWPEIEELAKSVQDGMKVIDLGCGNGRLLNSLTGKDIYYLGIDESEELIKIAKTEHPKSNFQVMTMQDLKIQDGSFDIALAIASLHHLAPRSKRIQAIKETHRILKKDGLFLLTVWNLWQPKYRAYIWKHLLKQVLNRTSFTFGDTLIPWKEPSGKKITDRYYFAYTKKSLEKDLQVGGFEVVELIDNGRNIVAICKK